MPSGGALVSAGNVRAASGDACDVDDVVAAADWGGEQTASGASETVLRHRPSQAAAAAAGTRSEPNRAQAEGEKDRWDDTDLSAVPDQVGWCGQCCCCC